MNEKGLSKWVKSRQTNRERERKKERKNNNDKNKYVGLG